MVRSIPDITKNTISIQAQLAEARNKFYKENADLLPWSNAVGNVMEEMLAKNPNKRYDELLPDVATEVRKRLNLKKEVKKEEDDPPPLPKNRKGQRQTPNPNLSDLDKAMYDMDNALGID